MSLESLRLLRNILLRSVVIAIACALILAAITFGFWNSWIGFVVNLFNTDENRIRTLVLAFFTEIRFFVIFFLLTPALAIHWTIKEDLSGKTTS